MIAQVLLVAATLAVAGLVFRSHGNRQLAMRRLAGVALAVGGVVAVLWPAGVTWLAHLVGIGRGADLLLYVMVMFFLFTTASLYQRVQTLQSQLTVVVREIAVAAPEPPYRAETPTTAAAGDGRSDA